MQNWTPKNWRKVRAEDLCIKVTDGTHDTPKRLSFSPYPLITSKQLNNGKIDLTDYFISEEDFIKINKRSKVDQWDVLFGMIGTVGDVVIVKDMNPKFAIKNVGLFKTGYNETLAKWLYYYFKSPQGKSYIKSFLRGTSQGYIPLESLRDFPIIIPENESCQKRIVSILSSFDEKIELNNKINETLEKMAQKIFDEWFNKYQISNIKYQRVKELIKIISGFPFSSKLFTNGRSDYGIVTIKNVQDGNFITECDSFVKEENVPKNINKECILNDGDILLSLTGNVGRVCFVYGGRFLLNQRVAKLEPYNKKNRAFCYFLFRQSSIQRKLVNLAKGSAQPNLSPIEVGELKLIPRTDLLERYNKVVELIYQLLIKNSIENQKLAAMRDLLLPKLMNGEIEV